MFFRRLRALIAHGPVYPRTCRDPEIAELFRGIGPGNRFKLAQEVLERPRSAEDRAWLIDEFAREFPIEPRRLLWAEAEPNNPLAHTLAGAVAVRWAWNARSSARAHMVSAERWQAFGQRLHIAEQYLTTAILLNESDPVPYGALMGVYLGRGEPIDRATELFHKAVALSPHDWTVHQTMLSYSCAKWGGSDQQMRAFVGRAIARAPAGCHLHALVPALLVEEYIALTFANPHTEPDALNKPQFRNAVIRAHDAYLRRKDRQQIKRELAHRNAFACTLAWTGAHDRAREELDYLGNRIMEFPWVFDGRHPRLAAKLAHQQALSAPGNPRRQ